jgi:hypothetical protein
MTANLVVPFDFKPYDTSSRNTNYSPSTGYYALAEINLYYGNLLLNGTAVLNAGHRPATLVNANTTVLTTSYQTWYTCPTDKIYKCTFAILRNDASAGTAQYSVRVRSSNNITRWSQAISGIAHGATATFTDILLFPGDILQALVDDAAIDGNSKTLTADTVAPTYRNTKVWLKEGETLQIDDEASGTILISEYVAIT